MMFYCTAGRGTEVFVAEELASRKIDNDACVTDGKIYFKCDQGSFEKLPTLKSVERIFVQIDHFSTKEIVAKGQYEFLKCLKDQLVQRNSLEEALKIYRCIMQHQETQDTREPATKRPRLDDTEAECPTFRVSSKVAGKWGKTFRGSNCREVSQNLGRNIVQLLGWKVELRNPNLEICVHINDDTVCAGIPISRHPMSKRSYFVQSGLRATIAYIMAHLAKIQTGDVVLDPMCGKATVLVEACRDVQAGHYLGLDISQDQLCHSVDNRRSASLENGLELGLANVTYLPLRAGCVDKVVCDAPFGQKYTTDMDMTEFYQLLLHEIHRVLRPGGTAVVMTSSDLKQTLLTCVRRLHIPAGSETQSQNLDLDSCDRKPTHTENTKLTNEAVVCEVSLERKGDYSDVHKIEAESQSDCTAEGDVKSSDTMSSSIIDQKVTVSSIDGVCETPAGVQVTESHLVVSSEHYVKLGETHAYIFVLMKENK